MNPNFTGYAVQNQPSGSRDVAQTVAYATDEGRSGNRRTTAYPMMPASTHIITMSAAQVVA